MRAQAPGLPMRQRDAGQKEGKRGAVAPNPKAHGQGGYGRPSPHSQGGIAHMIEIRFFCLRCGRGVRHKDAICCGTIASEEVGE